MTDEFHYPGTSITLEALDLRDDDGDLVTPDVTRIYIRREIDPESSTVQVSATSTGAGFARTSWPIPDSALPGRYLYAFDFDGTTVDQYKAGSFIVKARPVNVPQ